MPKREHRLRFIKQVCRVMWNDGAPVYSNDGGYHETTPPSPKSTWSGNVSVTFTYDPDKYEVDSEKKPGSNYTFDANTPGK